VEVDFGPLLTVAAMLYGSSFVAERYSGIRAFLDKGIKVKVMGRQNCVVDTGYCRKQFIRQSQCGICFMMGGEGAGMGGWDHCALSSPSLHSTILFFGGKQQGKSVEECVVSDERLWPVTRHIISKSGIVYQIEY
jgi:hypothetical protein